MKIKDLPEKYARIWEKASDLLKKGRADDYNHAIEVIEFILDYKGNLKIDKDILIPLAIMHDIGHSAILPEHFKHIAGPEKIINGKLVHMLAGAKIAKDILESVGYDKEKTKEIVEIISIHDFDQLKDIDITKVYDSENKKIFHDIDCLDRYTETRLKDISGRYPDKNKLFAMLRELSNNFFFPEIKKIALERLKELEKKHGI